MVSREFIFIYQKECGWESLKAKELRKTLNWILKLADCPICLSTLDPATVQCINGHLICQGCQKGQQECPTCRGPFSNVKPTGFIRQVIESLPHPCRHHDCKMFVKTNDKHEIYCDAQLTDCKLCDWNGPCRDIAVHSFSHKELLRPNEESAKSAWRLTILFQMKQSYVHPIFVNGQLFWLEIIYDPLDKFIVVVHPVLTRKVESIFYAQISLKLKKSRYQAGIIVNMDPTTGTDGNCISIPTSILPKYVGKNNTITYKFSIHRNKWESICNVVKSRLICVKK